ncbi:hypothetical protein ABIE44_000803 [Marmoricola sp. OAE513]|uniref:HNH endonuclease n=1 Tax=Marmoricola sp. OAE513 TaxID=2817894 RepID=UPI001AE56521
MFERFEAAQLPTREFLDAVATTPLPRDATAVIDEIRALEEIKCAAEARQARLALVLDEQRDSGAHAEIALARRISPHRGRQVLALARVLHELPHTRAAFDTGLISEWRATLIARETACLTLEDRQAIDEQIAADGVALSRRGDREITSFVIREAARRDAASVARRRRRAESGRRVTIRPAPDTMVYLTALLPVAQGVAAFAALRQAAATAIGTGEATNQGQAMADELVRRATGTVTGQPVGLRLTMPAETLLGGSDAPADLGLHGPIPAELARLLVAESLEAGNKVWLKRLFQQPGSGELIAMDSHARLFPRSLAEFLELRDQWCRNAYCGARIKHFDHVEPRANDGPTSDLNGQGLCEDCNQTKESPGWRSVPERAGPGRRHTVTTITPTGHSYRSVSRAGQRL